MHRIFLWQAVIFLFFFCAPYSFAQMVVLNEIFANPENEDDEFVELFNNSDSELDLKDWKITDLVKSYNITDSKISPKSFIVFEKSTTSIVLNNSSETVSLIDNLGNTIDSFSYEETIESTSWSRFPDGTGSFFNNTNVTKGTSNSSPPTPTPTITPTPTKIPTPTKAPSPTKVPTSAKTPTPLISPHTDLSDESFLNGEMDSIISPTRTVSKKKINVNPTLNKDVAGISDDDINGEPSVEKTTPNYLYSVTTGLGMIILGCGILLYKKFKSRKEEIDDF